MATTFNPTPSSIQIGRMLFRHPMAARQMAPSTGSRPQFQGGGGIPDSPMAPFSGAIGGTGLGRADTVPMHVPSGSYVLPADIVSHIGQGNSIAGQDVLRKMFGPWPYGASTGPYGAAMPQGAKGKGMGIPQPPEVRTRGMPRFQVGPGVAQNVVRPSPASGIPGDSHGGAVHPGEPGDRHGGAVHPGEPGSQFLDRMGAQTRATPIMASAGEFVIRPDEVARRGGGDVNKGHKLLDMWVKHLRAQHIKTLSKLPAPAK